MYDSKTKMIKKGTIAHPSELGHYNFHYPDVGSECIFTSDAIVKQPTWGKQRDLVAVSVVGVYLEGAEYLADKRYIVWVKDTDIERY
tara:strand:- start:156 stop:416 length:261 start_codon:yes stop_codon:yes gene_type:complete